MAQAESQDFRPPHSLSYYVASDGEDIVGQYLTLLYSVSESQRAKFLGVKYSTANEVELGYAFNQLGTWSLDLSARAYREGSIISQGAFLGSLSFNKEYFALDFQFEGERSELMDNSSGDLYFQFNSKKSGLQLTGYLSESLSLSGSYQNYQYTYDRDDLGDIFLQYLVSNDEGLTLLQTNPESEWALTLNYEFTILEKRIGMSFGHYETKTYLFSTLSVGNDLNIEFTLNPNWLLNIGYSASKDTSQNETTTTYLLGLTYRWLN